MEFICADSFKSSDGNRFTDGESHAEYILLQHRFLTCHCGLQPVGSTSVLVVAEVSLIVIVFHGEEELQRHLNCVLLIEQGLFAQLKVVFWFRALNVAVMATGAKQEVEINAEVVATHPLLSLTSTE